MKKFLPTSLKLNYDTDSLMLPLNASRMIKDHDEIDLVCKAISVLTGSPYSHASYHIYETLRPKFMVI